MTMKTTIKDKVIEVTGKKQHEFKLAVKTNFKI